VGDSPFFLIQVAGLIAVVAAYAAARWRDPRRRARRALSGVMDTPIGVVEDGARVRITGVVAVQRDSVMAPASRRPCVGYRLVVSVRGSAPGSELETILVRETCVPFWVQDESGRALVEGPFVLGLDPDERAYADIPPSVYAMLEEAQIPLAGLFGVDRDFQFTEARLMAGDRVDILGWASVDVDPAGGPAGRRKLPTLCRIVGTSTDPVILADVEQSLTEPEA
jgi:hypothetical protein